jgi:high-affinity iron transporter
MGNALFIVWRESVEAMLVIGVLHAWVRRNGSRGLGALWTGTAAGAALAALLGWAMVAAQDELSGATLEWFQLAMLLVAAGLIVQMVLWMQRHGRHMKRELESGLERATARAGAAGIAVIAALAIAREGAETAIFLYGMGVAEGASRMATGAVAGLGLALLTAWIVSRGLGLLDYRRFFRISGALLLLFAAALLSSAVDRLIGGGWLPALVDPLWNSAALLDDGSPAGALVAAFTGYRARPSLTLAAVYALYWIAVLTTQRRLARHA